MSVRAIQARIECDRATLEHLWRTHRVVHERLPLVLRWLFKMRRGEIGETAEKRRLAKAFARGVLLQDAKNAYDRMLKAANSSKRNGTARKALRGMAESQPRIVRDYERAFDKFVQGWRPLSDLRSALHDLPKSIEVKLYQEAVAIISGHDELVANWNSEHAKWLDEKREWEKDAEHKQYLVLRPKFEAFEASVGGKASKRRGRWHLYLDWLRGSPDLAAWRGGSAVVSPLSPQAQERIRKAKPWKTRSVEAEEFWNVNPELAALDKLHGLYEREFVRRRKTKRNPDGFDHRPTFTMPHPVNHPRWFVFNAPQTNPAGYRELRLPEPRGLGSIQLQLLTGECDGQADCPTEWVELRFRADPRLALFRRVEVSTTINRRKAKGQTKTKLGYEFLDPHLHRPRSAKISGAKLIFRDIHLGNDGSLLSAVPYLVFTCTIEDLPLTDRAKKIEWPETGETTKSGKKRKSCRLPDGLVACAVDLGLRHVGFATLCVYKNGKPRIVRSRNIWLDDEGGGPDLGHIGRHKRQIKRLRRQRGKPVKGEDSHVNLQSHITHMGQDRFKKAARGIINFAWNIDEAREKATGEALPRADVIILEKLAGFIPDGEKERGINRGLAAWNRGQLVTRLKEMAIDAGYRGRVFEIHPAGTSQVCSLCGKLGRRYSISRDNDARQPDIRFGWVEKLFACTCGYRANSDHNASVNLHRKFLMREEAVKSFFAWRNQGQEKRQQDLDDLDNELLDALRKLHRLQAHTLATPF